MIYLAVILLGLLFGSFANVCIARLPNDESIATPGSHCPKCGKFIKWYDNIPVISYIILKAKCRKCSQPISIQYPLIELLMCFAFLLVAFKYKGNYTAIAFFCAYAFILITVSIIDYYHQIIPDGLSLSLVILGIAYNFINSQLLFAIIGCFSSALLLYAVAWIGELVFKKEAMGGGDIKLIAGIGAFLGFSKTLMVLFLGSLLGSIIGIFLIYSHRIEKRQYIPFGPFLALAAYVVIFIPHYLMIF